MTKLKIFVISLIAITLLIKPSLAASKIETELEECKQYLYEISEQRDKLQVKNIQLEADLKIKSQKFLFFDQDFVNGTVTGTVVTMIVMLIFSR